MQQTNFQQVPEKIINEDEQKSFTLKDFKIDYKQYSFAPLLLFTEDKYFEKGFSNYNAVEEFYRKLLLEDYNIDMLLHAVYERKNMKYEELFKYCVDNKSIVICCIDEHFTAFNLLSKDALIFYDPLSSDLKYISGSDNVEKFTIFHLVKCKYGDSGHISEQKDYYTGSGTNSLRKCIYSTWKTINDTTQERFMYYMREKNLHLGLKEYCLINSRRNPKQMSTQLTGNTCYFQSYLFCLLMKVCQPTIQKGSSDLQCANEALLKQITLDMAKYTLDFYFKNSLIRPYNNSNIIIDYYKYKLSGYFQLFLNYVQQVNYEVDYEEQYKNVVKFLLEQPVHQKFDKITGEEKMESTPNTKQLQLITNTNNARERLFMYNYYKYRPANVTFAFNTYITRKLSGFSEFNALRKNTLLLIYDKIQKFLQSSPQLRNSITKYRDYYFMPSYEIGQQELIDLHFYTYLLDYCSICKEKEDFLQELVEIVAKVNSEFLPTFRFSTQKSSSYEKIMSQKDFEKNKEYKSQFLRYFMSAAYLSTYCSLGFDDFNPKEKDVTCLTQSVFYDAEMMRRQMFRMEFEFERECVNQMAKNTLQKYLTIMDNDQNMKQQYHVQINIGKGITYSKYNNLLHFVNVVDKYWNNPDINYIQIFGKDVRNVLGFLCQKIIFSDHHDFYHYGHIEHDQGYYQNKQDLLVSNNNNFVQPLVSMAKRDPVHNLVISDKVYEYKYIKNILINFLKNKQSQLKTDDEVLNLCLLNLILDFGLYDEYASYLNIPYLKRSNGDLIDKKELQIQISNTINEMDKKNKEAIQRSKIENLINECSHKFIVNAHLSQRSEEFQLMNIMNQDQIYQTYIALCKIYMSLCQINKSVELDYYKLKCEDSYKIIIPVNYSPATSNYLDKLTHKYNFYEENGFLCYDNMQFFNISKSQPEINLFKIKLQSQKPYESMYRYIEISNTFELDNDKDVVFVAGNTIVLHNDLGKLNLTLNNIPIEYDLVCFNEAISLVPCFKYKDAENKKSDVALITSPHMYYHVDSAGQFNENYYGMKEELIDLIFIERSFTDLNDNLQFKQYKLSELTIESKSVFYFPHYLLQPQSQDQLISLLDLAIKFRNISFFIYVFWLFKRTYLSVSFKVRNENKVKLITGPWYQALLYAYQGEDNKEYDLILKKQFFQINQYKELPLTDFINKICENFTTYQQHLDDGTPQIVPTQKQKNFIEKIIKGEESFYFSEVGSGKTKVILPILCQMFLSNNLETHKYLSKFNNSQIKSTLFVIVPEHLVLDAQSQVYRYCLNLNFRSDYKIYDDVFYLKHKNVNIEPKQKKIFITSFNQFKKALTDDVIQDKLYSQRQNIQLIIDEVDDFLDRDKLVFNICSNKNNDFQKDILECYYQTSYQVYMEFKKSQIEQKKLKQQKQNGKKMDIEEEENQENDDQILEEAQNLKKIDFSDFPNKDYWEQLFNKFLQINEEIQHKSKSINKSFGIFNENTLKHCTNIAHDIEGYKGLIARPYESVNRGMSGSYYSDVERTIFLTYYILMEDTEKYNELFQQERKNITFEFYMHYIHQHHLDYDDLIYGRTTLVQLIKSHPGVKQGLIKFLYQIILRKMEIHDKSRSVNSVDVIFNFDCTGFTGTPFIDNYPTFQYIIKGQTDKIPDLINRDFYLHSNDPNKDELYKQKFVQFQGDNNNIMVKYVSSEFIQEMDKESQILEAIFSKQKQQDTDFNCIVDLCGIFKRITMHGVRNVLRNIYGKQKFKYIYYIDQITCSDRILFVENDNDIQYDDEFCKYLVNQYQEKAPEKIFFYIDNRNVIGKDIPFQLIFKKKFDQPLIYRSLVVAHDIDDFSKIWQAMGRSRTMNYTQFIIYKNGIQNFYKKQNGNQNQEQMMEIENQKEFTNMQNCEITKSYYIKNCDKKVIGNISSIYQTLIAIYNLSQKQFYYNNNIINIFLLKMNGTIQKLLYQHQKEIINNGLGQNQKKTILSKIISDKLRVHPLLSQNGQISQEIDFQLLNKIVDNLILYKFEQNFHQTESEELKQAYNLSEDIVKFLSGQEEHIMEISYTKQQQKQKQNQMNKNQDSDTILQFSKDKQLPIAITVPDYFEFTKISQKNNYSDSVKNLLNVPLLNKEIAVMKYTSPEGQEKTLRVFPTVQFLYSLYINPDYIDVQEIKSYLSLIKDELKEIDPSKIRSYFIQHIQQKNKNNSQNKMLVEENEEELLVQKKQSLSKLDQVKKTQVTLQSNGDSSFEEENNSDEEQKNNKKDNENNNNDSQYKLKAQEKKKLAYYKSIKSVVNNIKQNPQFTLYCVEEGTFIVGMKNQFSAYDISKFALSKFVHYVTDETGHVLYNNEKCSNYLGQAHKLPSNQQRHQINPYNLDLYIFLDNLTKQELAFNVVNTYYTNPQAIEKGLQEYSGEQGDGFICWRFIMRKLQKILNTNTNKDQQ